jgi:hypothetical protein
MPAQHDVYGKPVYLTPDPSTYDHWGQAAALGVGAEAVKHLGEQVAEDRGSQKAIKGLLKMFGAKVSNKSIGQLGSKVGKAAPIMHVIFAGGAAVQGYRACMAE